MAVLPIRIYPDPILRVRCREVEAFDEELKRLATDMVETMQAAPGVGLAACQVGVELRLVVVDISVGEDPAGLLVLVNPTIVERQGQDVDEEGCLSLPGLTEKVERAVAIKLQAMDVAGKPFDLEAEGLLARVIQHEVDHVDGVLFVDHLKGLRRDRVRRQLKRLARQQEVTA